MRKAFIFLGVLACVALDVRAAHAQDKKDPGGGKIHTRDEVQNSGNAERARARVRQGDCAGALDLFDAALRTSMDPSVKRDRGLCHEELGHPFPAIEDYRAYLTGSPNAKDFDQIRERLEKLEQAQGPDAEEVKVNPELGGDKASAIGMVSLGEGNTGASAKLSTGKDKDSVSPEAIDASDPEAANSAIRRGTGFALGAYFAGRESGFGNSNVGSGYGVGAALRQSFSRVSSVVMDLGYAAYKLDGNVTAPGASAGVSGDTLDGTPLRGFALLVGYEARFALDARTTNAILLGGGFEWNRLAVANGPSLSVFFPRGRAGFRHVFGPSLGLETSLEVSKPLPAGSNARDFETFEPFRAWKDALMFGLQVAVVTGF